MERQREPKEMKTDRRDAAFNAATSNKAPLPEEGYILSPEEQKIRASNLSNVGWSPTVKNFHVIEGLDLSGEPGDRLQITGTAYMPIEEPDITTQTQNNYEQWLKKISTLAPNELKKFINDRKAELNELKNNQGLEQKKETLQKFYNDAIAKALYALSKTELPEIIIRQKRAKEMGEGYSAQRAEVLNKIIKELNFLETGWNYLLTKGKIDNQTRENIGNYQRLALEIKNSIAN